MKYKEPIFILVSLVVIYILLLIVGGEYADYKQAEIFNSWKESGSQDTDALVSMGKAYFSSEKFGSDIRMVSTYPVALVSFSLGCWFSLKRNVLSVYAFLYIAIIAYLLDFDILLVPVSILSFYACHLVRLTSRFLSGIGNSA